MAVRHNIGKFSRLFERVEASYKNAPSGIMTPLGFDANNYQATSWDQNVDNRNIFLWGADDWALPSKKVTK